MNVLDEMKIKMMMQKSKRCPLCQKGDLFEQPQEISEGWGRIWDFGLGIITFGILSTGSMLRGTRMLCPKCGRQFTLDKNTGKLKETFVSKYFLIK